MMYRKGVLGTGLLYFVYFLMMALILAGIYGGLIAFFGKGYDSRLGESRLLLKETRECFEREKFDLSSLDKPVFFDKCKFSSKVIEDGNHFIYVNNSKGAELSIGVSDYKVRCGLDARLKNREYPLCDDYKSDNYYILVGSSQNSRRVAA